MKHISMVLWLVIVLGLFLGHMFTMVSLAVAILYIVCMQVELVSWKEGSKNWKENASFWYDTYIDLLESNPDDIYKAVEEYQIKKLTK